MSNSNSPPAERAEPPVSTKPPLRGGSENGPDDRPDHERPQTSKFNLNVFATEPEASPEAQAANSHRSGILGGTPGSVVIVTVLAALAVITVLLIIGSGNSETVAVPLTLATTTTAAPTTSVAATTSVMIATTVAPPTTTPPPTTTVPVTTTTTTQPFIAPSGDPVDVDQLVLGAFGIGDLRLGDPAGAVLGNLVSSLGQPETIAGPFESTGELGTCVGDQLTAYWWGPLGVVTRTNPAGDEVFYSYRLDGRNSDPQAPAAAMRTLSGLGLGDTVGRTLSLYSEVFDVELIDHAVEGPAYEIREDGVLLWGPVTSTASDGIIEGIFSPDPCGGPLSG